MKKEMIVLVLTCVVVVLGAILWVAVSKAHCWDCKPRRCTFDIECGIGCFCYKGSGDIKGVCVTDD